MECNAKACDKKNDDHDAPTDPAYDLRGSMIITIAMPEVRLTLRLSLVCDDGPAVSHVSAQN